MPIRFHVISAEVSDQLTERINEWMDQHHDDAHPSFTIRRWHVSHDASFMYWTVEYTD